MRVVITGGLGFVGRALAAALAGRGELAGEPLEALVLADGLQQEIPSDVAPGAEVVPLDVCNEDAVRDLLRGPRLTVFHLASVVSGAAERDFDSAMRVNLDGTRHVLEACRHHGAGPRVVFASSVAVFGGAAVLANASDLAKQTPGTTDGVTKAVGGAPGQRVHAQGLHRRQDGAAPDRDHQAGRAECRRFELCERRLPRASGGPRLQPAGRPRDEDRAHRAGHGR